MLRPQKSGKKAFPCLKAKAAEARSLLFVMQDVCVALGTPTDKAKHRLAAVASLCAMYRVFLTGPVVLPEEGAKAALEHCEAFLLHYNWLLHSSLHKGDLLYNFTFKFHHLWHISHLSAYLNPVATWCYKYEDFMGKLVQSAKACLAGSPMEIVGNKCMENYLLVLELSFRFAR
eukprot:1326228-Alexandrium_andersonii.AAC.1